jgi:transcriptional regulator with XRE-family HTH domain
VRVVRSRPVDPSFDAALDAFLRLVGHRVAVLRQRAGLTQAELAERIGSHVKHLQSVERGDRNFSQKTSLKLAVALGCESVADLYLNLDEDPPRITPYKDEGDRLLDTLTLGERELPKRRPGRPSRGRK